LNAGSGGQVCVCCFGSGWGVEEGRKLAWEEGGRSEKKELWLLRACVGGLRV